MEISLFILQILNLSSFLIKVKNMNEHSLRNGLSTVQNRKIQLITIGIVLLIITCTVIVIPIVLLTKHNTQIETTRAISITTIATTTTITTLFKINLSNTSVRSWNPNGITIAAGNGQGNKTNQLSRPIGFYIDDKTIYIADSGNNRIVQWEFNATYGKIITESTGRNQLSNPTDVVLDKKNQSIIICDDGNRRIIRWSIENSDQQEIIISNRNCFSLVIDNQRYLYVSNPIKNEIRKWNLEDSNNDGIIVAGGFGEGTNENHFNYPTFFFLDQHFSLYITDRNNNRAMKWFKNATKGILIAENIGQNKVINSHDPTGVILDRFHQIFIADRFTNRIVRWHENRDRRPVIIVGYGNGADMHCLNRPHDVSFDTDDNLYVVDTDNHRIQKYLFNK